jgi:hypothetical protein
LEKSNWGEKIRSLKNIWIVSGLVLGGITPGLLIEAERSMGRFLFTKRPKPVRVALSLLDAAK